MAVGDYRAWLPTMPEIQGVREVRFHNAELQRCDDLGPPEVWTMILRRTVRVPSYRVVEISEGPGTIQQKRQLLMDEIEAIVLHYGLAQSDQATRAFIALLPGGTYPPTGVYIPITLDE